MSESHKTAISQQEILSPDDFDVTVNDKGDVHFTNTTALSPFGKRHGGGAAAWKYIFIGLMMCLLIVLLLLLGMSIVRPSMFVREITIYTLISVLALYVATIVLLYYRLRHALLVLGSMAVVLAAVGVLYELIRSV